MDICFKEILNKTEDLFKKKKKGKTLSTIQNQAVKFIYGEC